ncbi:hypothetical protein L486_02271 [Kwoniella mangroviensis CBS 10435]|uniref:Uncharacterized protein n=1 Tax=Kwoniella mangroviensis CBS 10435 TaxID=1331196 RepID=A0A1B9IVN6_9TREE|nr:hypothetical protein L486_02271 [Kwoniella mangroviensis CBS 10435]
MPSPSSTHSRETGSGSTSKGSKWRDPKFLKQIRGGSSNTRYSSQNDTSHSTLNQSHHRTSPVREESITITRTTSYAKDDKNHSTQRLNGTGTTVPHRPSVSRRVSSTEYAGQGHPMSRQVSNSGSSSPPGQGHGLHPYYSGVPLSRQASISSQQPSANGYGNGNPESRPSISRRNSCSKHPNCKIDDSSGKYTLHVFSAPRGEAREPSIDRHSRTRSSARDHEDISTPSRRSHDPRGRSSSRVSARYSPPDREYEYGGGREERNSRRRGDSRGPNYQLPNGSYDSPPSHTPPSRPSIDHRQSSSQAPNANANGYDRGYTQRFSIESFNPRTMDLIRFRRDGGGIETNIRERFDVGPRWVYGSTTDILRTSPNHYPIRTPDDNLVWRSKCPHTDGSNRPEECKILHTNLDPSSISITPIADTDHTNYSICLMSPHHPSIRGAELNYDTSSNTLEAKVRAVENIQQDMANRFIEWSNTPGGRQRLDLENVFMAGCDSWMNRKDRLNRYKLEINGTTKNTITNGNGHVTSATTSVSVVNPIIKRFKGLSTGLENLSKGLEQITSNVTNRTTTTNPSNGITILDRLDRVTAGFENEVNKNFEDMKTLAVDNMTELLREKNTTSTQPTQISSHPQNTIKGNGSKVRFNLADEKHLKDTLGNSIPSTASVTNTSAQPPGLGSGSGSAVGRAAALATRTDQSSRFFKDHFKTIRQSITDLIQSNQANAKSNGDSGMSALGKDLDKINHQMVENQITVDSLKESVQKSQNGWIDKIDRELEDIQREEERLKVFRNILLS